MKTSRLSIIAIASLLALTGCNKSGGSKKSESSQAQSSGESSQTSESSQPGSSSSSAGGSESSSTSEQTGPVITEPTNITIWTTYNDNYQTIINNAIDEFKTIEPNVTITNTKQQGSYNDLAKMVTDGFAVDNYPDMVAAYPDEVTTYQKCFRKMTLI